MRDAISIDANMTHLLVGLGNPGLKYAATRHNVGFMILDHMAQRHSVCFAESPWQGLLTEIRLNDHRVILLKPSTFMNRSGEAVAPLATFLGLLPAQVIVVHDDLDLAPGRIKIRGAGGDGGHRGVASIIENLKTNSFTRFRVGIGRPQPTMVETAAEEGGVTVTDYVLADFNSDGKQLLEGLMDPLVDLLEVFVRKGVEAAMNLGNRRR